MKGHAEPTIRRAAFLRMAGCSLLFMVVYGGTNWITAQRLDVGTWCYAWELNIPFIPWMIVPYWSIDLFFLGAFFLCRDRKELDTLALRIAVAIVVAGACFLAFPLRICFPRPDVSGVPGALFASLRAFDQPYNLVPSLHIALRTILADIYARHTRGAARWLIHIWFSVIGFSTLFTYQHQIVDVIGGFILAVWCFYLVRESGQRLPVARNPRVGGYYGIGSAALAWLATAAWPWGSVLFWPAASLSIVACAYFGFGPSAFRKEGGRMPLSSRLILGPVLLGHQISLIYYRRQCRPWDEAAPGVWIGRTLRDREAAEAMRRGVTAVLDLTAELPEARPFLSAAYRNVPILDLTAPTQEQLRETTDFIRAHASDGVVYVHCKIGYSRSAAVVGAYLIATGAASDADEAIATLRAARPSLVVRPEAHAALRAQSARPRAVLGVRP